MKTGKSISQFDPQSALTGDEWLLVNVETNPHEYVSRKVRLSTLRDYIISIYVDRYVVSEDHTYDIILGGTDDGVFLDYQEPRETREGVQSTPNER